MMNQKNKAATAPTSKPTLPGMGNDRPVPPHARRPHPTVRRLRCGKLGL